MRVTRVPTAAAGDEAAGDEAARRGVPIGHINFGQRLQAIDGFGVSQAFQRAALIRGLLGLTPQNRDRVVDLLFHRERGAGLSILRLGIGSSTEDRYDLMKSIQPTDPGGPDATPRYEWDGDDGGQVWLARQAKAYGVRRFYADAWSPPGYMKTNGTENDGGQLLGLPGADPEGADWRQAYAEYLVQYVRFYAQEGIHITDLGFTNEPDLRISYASMRITPEQVVDFLKVFGPTVARSGLGLYIACCDATGWAEQAAYTAAIEADPQAARWVDVHTGHAYPSPADTPLPTPKKMWMSEWQPDGDSWTEAWDDGTGWAGITVAESIHDTLALAGASAYIYWLGASIGTTRAFIQLDGGSFHVAKRLWAMAAYSRFIRPDAVRVAARFPDPVVKVTAFHNADGTGVIEVLNTGTSSVDGRFTVTGGRGPVRTYLTDETHSLAETGGAGLRGDRLTTPLPPRSLTTIVW